MAGDPSAVPRCLRRETWQPYLRLGRADTLLAPHAEWLRERAPQVQYSARILFQELRQSRGYPGSYDTVKLFVQPLRAVRRQAERALTRFETPPGLQSQIDWGIAHRPPAGAPGSAPHLRPDPGLQPPEHLRPVSQ
jgi:hypothetical protein